VCLRASILRYLWMSMLFLRMEWPIVWPFLKGSSYYCRLVELQ
jgi:hypothetical protein